MPLEMELKNKMFIFPVWVLATLYLFNLLLFPTCFPQSWQNHCDTVTSYQTNRSHIPFSEIRVISCWHSSGRLCFLTKCKIKKFIFYFIFCTRSVQSSIILRYIFCLFYKHCFIFSINCNWLQWSYPLVILQAP